MAESRRRSRGSGGARRSRRRASHTKRSRRGVAGPRLAALRQALRRLRRRWLRLPTPRLLVLGYASYVAVGWLLLALPVTHAGFWSEAPQAGVGPLDALFVAVSAVSTTGLVTVSPSGDFNAVGQVVILLLFQLGAIGYMTAGSFYVLASGHHLSSARRRLGQQAFRLPRGFRIEAFVKRAVLFTLAIEALGSVALYLAFRAEGVDDAAWPALFHSVSAFCTAGFSLFDDSLERFRGDPWVSGIVAGLALTGALGFIVFTDALGFLRRSERSVTLTTKIILATTATLVLGGAVLLFFEDPRLAALPTGERVLASLFQAAAASSTVGFDTVPIASLAMPSLVLLMLLMIVGASPAGTGGGVKSTSISALLGLVRSTFRQREEVTFFGRQVPHGRVQHAAATVTLYVGVLVGSLHLLTLTEPAQAFVDLAFEATSALGTVGLSRGVTPELSAPGKIVVMVCMFVGRVGPLAFALAFVDPHEEDEEPEAPSEDLAV